MSRYVLNIKFCICTFQATMQLADTHATNVAALNVIFSSLVLITKIFYSLNFQVVLNIVLKEFLFYLLYVIQYHLPILYYCVLISFLSDTL